MREKKIERNKRIEAQKNRKKKMGKTDPISPQLFSLIFFPFPILSRSALKSELSSINDPSLCPKSYFKRIRFSCISLSGSLCPKLCRRSLFARFSLSYCSRYWILLAPLSLLIMLFDFHSAILNLLSVSILYGL